MKLRITSPNGSRLEVTDADTGAVLEGVKSVRWDSDWIGGPKVTLELSKVAIDMSVNADRVEAFGIEDNKYAHMPLKEVGRLRWLTRK